MSKRRNKVCSIFLTGAALIFTAACSPAQATCMTGDPFPYTAPDEIDECPADIQNWMDRVNLCAHFAGEELYDENRRAFISAAIEENKCSAVGCDFQILFSQYEGDIVYAGVLSAYAELVYGSIDDMPQCPAAQG